jgi:CBS domain-containing protein
MTQAWIVSETPVSALMADKVVKVAPEATLLDVVDALTGADIGALVVMEDHRVVGVVSERDIVYAISERRPLDTTRAIDVATRDLAWCDVDATVTEVANEMAERYVRHVLVEREGTLVGIVSGRDLLGFYASEDEAATSDFEPDLN